MNYEKSLRVLLTNALSSVYEKELAKNNESDIGSRKHYRKMSRILALSLTASGALVNVRRRALIAILVAAALLLFGGCGVVFHEEISEAFRDIFEDHIIIRFEISDPKEQIIERYHPSYIPEGFHAHTKDVGDNFYERQYMTDDGLSLRYSQFAPSLDNYSVYFDEASYYDIQYKGKTYFYNKGPVFDSIYWFHDGYIFHLKTNFTLTEEELFRIIDSIVLTEDPPPS